MATSPRKKHTQSLARSFRLGVIEIVCKGKAGLIGGEATEFRYLLLENGKVTEEEDEGFVL